MIEGPHRLVLFCKDTAQSKQWYEQVGFTYKHGHDGMHWFAFGSGEIMLHPADTEKDGDAAQLPSFHASVADLDTFFAHVKSKGLKPFDHQAPGVVLEKPVERPWGEREFELTDPDGHRWAFNEV